MRRKKKKMKMDTLIRLKMKKTLKMMKNKIMANDV